jgi:regulatory protein
VDSSSAHTEGLKLLARRELSMAQLRARLEERGFPRDAIDEAVARLQDAGALDDGRMARAYAQTAVDVKGRGRLRVMRELLHMGIAQDVTAAALGEVFADRDERALIARAVQKKLRGRPRLDGPGDYARLYQYLMRQGFSPAGIAAALRRFRGSAMADQE